jgi:cytochrome c oxidase subunit 3
VERLEVEKIEDHINSKGEIHNSSAPIILSLAITLCLGGLLVWPLVIIGLPVLIYAIYRWTYEETILWNYREEENDFESWNDSSWAMLWIIITEAIIFASFFAYWFWTRWHTVSWSEAVGGSWPPPEVEHDLTLVSINTVILLLSGFTAHKSLEKHLEEDYDMSKRLLLATICLGLSFLLIQMYEYYNAGFIWSDHPYGTAFFSLTGLHGLHVMIGIIMFSVVFLLMKKGFYDRPRYDSFRAITMYWHFVDAVWILLFFIVYLEAI